MSELAEQRLLTEIRVPEGTGVMVHTLICPISSDGSMSVPSGYTAEQEDAIIAYLTWNNDHLDRPRGARLRMMAEEQQALLDKAIQTLKSPGQLLKERIVNFVLAEYQPSVPGRDVWCSWYEETDLWKEEYVNDGRLPSMDTLLFEVSLAEGRIIDHKHMMIRETEYRVAVLPDNAELPEGDISHTTRFAPGSQLRIIASWVSHKDDDNDEDE